MSEAPPSESAIHVSAGTAEDSDPQLAHTLMRGLRVLQCFNAAQPRLGNRDLAELTGLPKPTISRLTHTLSKLGYLRRAAGSLRFEVGPAALCLGYPVLAELSFRRMVMPHLQKLAQEVDGIAVIAVRDRLRMVTLESADQRDLFGRRPNIGSTRDLIGSTLGLCWLVHATSTEREDLMRQVAAQASSVIDRVRSDLEVGRRQLGRHGYVSLRNVLAPNTSTLATPLFRRPGSDLFVLGCSVEAPWESLKEKERSAADQLHAAARHISQGMG